MTIVERFTAAQARLRSPSSSTAKGFTPGFPLGDLRRTVIRLNAFSVAWHQYYRHTSLPTASSQTVDERRRLRRSGLRGQNAPVNDDTSGLLGRGRPAPERLRLSVWRLCRSCRRGGLATRRSALRSTPLLWSASAARRAVRRGAPAAERGGNDADACELDDRRSTVAAAKWLGEGARETSVARLRLPCTVRGRYRPR
jgi:hypothetical protein